MTDVLSSSLDPMGSKEPAAGRIKVGHERMSFAGRLYRRPGGQAVEHDLNYIHQATEEPPSLEGRTHGPSTPLLTGRDAELSLLRSLVQETASGGGQLVSLTGEAGMGKTTLLETLAAEAARAGAVVSVGRAWEAMDAPVLWPWVQTFRTLLREPRFAEIESVVAAAEVLQSSAIANVSGFDLLDLLAAAVADASSRAPLVLIFDDAHAADERTLEVLEFIAKTQRPRRGLILLAYEEGRAEQGTGSRRATLLSAIAREGARLGVGPLSNEAISRLFEHQAGRRPDETEVEVIARLSEGNPLFAEEAVQLMVAKQVLNRPDHSAGFRVPKGARDLIRQRLAFLDDSVLELLSVASVIGRSFSVGLLTQVTELESNHVLELLDQGLRAYIVKESTLVGDYSFSHILIRETLYESLTAALRMRLHRNVAEVMESLPDDGSGTRQVELAHHWFKAAQAGDPERALPYFIEAAQQADARRAHGEAARLRQRALNTAVAGRLPKSVVQELRSALEVTLENTPDVGIGTGSSMSARAVLEGEFVTLEFQSKTARMRDSKGLSYLRLLLKDPDREFHALDLLGQQAITRPTASEVSELDFTTDAAGSVDTLMDEQARTQIQRHIAELRSRIQEAEEFKDLERAERARTELEQVTQHLAAAFGLGGRARQTGSAAERARISVTKAIKDALRKIEATHQPLADHLHRSVRTGTFCSYRPDPQLRISWEIR